MRQARGDLMSVIGIDASLVRSGVALPDGSTEVWRTRKLRAVEYSVVVPPRMLDDLRGVASWTHESPCV